MLLLSCCRTPARLGNGFTHLKKKKKSYLAILWHNTGQINVIELLWWKKSLVQHRRYCILTQHPRGQSISLVCCFQNGFWCVPSRGISASGKPWWIDRIVFREGADITAATERRERKQGHSRTRHSHRTPTCYLGHRLRGKCGNLGFEGEMERSALQQKVWSVNWEQFPLPSSTARLKGTVFP